jgi:hypothetical protein
LHYSHLTTRCASSILSMCSKCASRHGA